MGGGVAPVSSVLVLFADVIASLPSVRCSSSGERTSPAGRPKAISASDVGAMALPLCCALRRAKGCFPMQLGTIREGFGEQAQG